jgi:hypothetical protein
MPVGPSVPGLICIALFLKHTAPVLYTESNGSVESESARSPEISKKGLLSNVFTAKKLSPSEMT